MCCMETRAEAVSQRGSYLRNPSRHNEGPEVVKFWYYLKRKALLFGERRVVDDFEVWGLNWKVSAALKAFSVLTYLVSTLN